MEDGKGNATIAMDMPGDHLIVAMAIKDKEPICDTRIITVDGARPPPFPDPPIPPAPIPPKPSTLEEVSKGSDAMRTDMRGGFAKFDARITALEKTPPTPPPPADTFEQKLRNAYAA